MFCYITNILLLLLYQIYPFIISIIELLCNKLTINGDSDVQQLKAQALSTEKIKLPVATPGQSCIPLDQSLAVASDGTGRLLVCPIAGGWTFYNP
jgi:hypothetical protein